MQAKVTIIGQDRLIRHLKKMSNAPVVFDPDFKKIALAGSTVLKKTTPRMTGHIARAWSSPRKLGLSKYENRNDIKTEDKKHLIASILNYGRGVVRPIRSNKLYIPISEKGRSKSLGSHISQGLIFGEDYILADKANSYKGTRFIDKSIKSSLKGIVRLMLDKINKVHRGQ